MEITASFIFEGLSLVVLGILPIANPLSTAPLFITLTSSMPDGQRQQIARRASFYMAAILLMFFFAGAGILQFFGITLAGLQVAGGLIISYTGFRMLYPEPVQRDQSVGQPSQSGDPALVPLAMPTLSGPGSISVVIGMTSRIEQNPELATVFLTILAHIVVVIGILICALVTWLVLRSAKKVMERVSIDQMDAITKIFGFIIVCIGVEFIRNGVFAFVQ